MVFGLGTPCIPLYKISSTTTITAAGWAVYPIAVVSASWTAVDFPPSLPLTDVKKMQLPRLHCFCP